MIVVGINIIMEGPIVVGMQGESKSIVVGSTSDQLSFEVLLWHQGQRLSFRLKHLLTYEVSRDST